MRGWTALVLAICALLSLAGCQPADRSARESNAYPPVVEERVALVIGNGGYREFLRLPAARDDADIVADALRRQGFHLIGGGALHDLDWAQMVQYMRVFEARMREGGVAVFYHSGHAAQINGENFLVPVDAGAWEADTVDTELVRLAGSFRPPAGREPRIKLVMLDRTLPGPLLGGPVPVLDMTLAEEVLEANEIQIFAAAPGSRIEAAEAILGNTMSSNSPSPDTSAENPSILAQAFADALRTPYAPILSVAYQVNVIVADHTDDHQHVMTRFGDGLAEAGPLVGSEDSRSLLARLDEAERRVLSTQRAERQPIRSSISELIGSETRSIQAVSDTVATLTVLNIDETFPLSRSGRIFVGDDETEIARLEAWRRVLEESRASTLDDWQKSAVLSVTSSTSSNRLHAAGIDAMLENGEFAGLPDAIESLAEDVSAATQTARISIERRRIIERALFELSGRGHGAGAIVSEFDPLPGVNEPDGGILLDARLNRARSAVADCSPTPLNANQMESLASFASSVGVEAFQNSSICRRLGDGQMLEVARELAYSSFTIQDATIVHDTRLMRRRAYETALFLAVTEGAARDRLHEVRLARSLQEQGIEVAANATEQELEAAAVPQLVTLEAPTAAVAQAFSAADGLRNAAYFIRMFEGLELDAYQDIVGVWTIGFGTTGPDIGPGMHISPDQAMRYLLDYIDADWRALDAGIDPELAPNEQAALLSLSYNVGRGRVAGSTLLAQLNQENRDEAAEEFLRWNQARVGGELQVVRGLDRRRHAERALFLIQRNPDIAETVIMDHTSLTERPQDLRSGQALIGFGHVGDPGDLPRRVDAVAAQDLLRTELNATRADISNRLTRPLEPLQIEALTIMAYAMGMDRFQRTPILTYINEGNTQAALAAIGYWDDSQIGAGGRQVENWSALRSNAAALFTMGFRS
ncbi:glycoside hydrolase family protein [Maricaulis parjimensis]|uniref:glycoside hydrolase family protein n=1 Tax=Maricaulis parjimensis TaxID=144023 RepID=UPI00193A95BA|nr:glycoside hydrolase family protein [Maricaulis parjimensis]